MQLGVARERAAGAEARHRVRLRERAHDEHALARREQPGDEAGRVGRELGQRRVDDQPDALLEPLGQRHAGRRARARRPVGSFGVHSATALVSGPAAAASAPVSGTPSAVSGTGTGTPPASWTSRGSGPQPGHAIATWPPVPSARNAACSSSPAPWPGATWSARHAVARSERLAQRPVVGVGVDRAPQRVGRGVDGLGIGRLVPGGRREVERPDLGQRARPLGVAALLQLLRDLLGRELLELAVVVAQAPDHCGRLDAGALDQDEPDGERGPGDDGRGREDADEDAVALLVPGGAPQDPPHAVEPRGERQREHQRADHAGERDRDARA